MDACIRRSPSSSSATRSPGGVNNNSKSTSSSCSVVAAGSVWETRMRSDEVNGGIKVFNGGEAERDDQKNAEPGGGGGGKCEDEGERLPLPSSNSNSSTPKGTTDKRNVPLTNGGGKRKTWKSDRSSADGPIAQHSRSRSDRLSVNEKSPGVQAKKGKKDVTEKSPIPGRKLRSELTRSLPELRKVRSDSGKGEVGDGVGGSNSTSSSAQLRKTKSEPQSFVDEAAQSVGATEKGEMESGSDGICKEIEVCGDKINTSSSDQKTELPGIQSTETNEPDDDDEYSEDEDEEDAEDEEEIVDDEIEVKSLENLKEITTAEPEPCQEPENTISEEKKQSVAIEKPNPIPANVNKQRQINEKPKPIVVSTNANRQPPHSPPSPSPSPLPVAIKHTTTTSNRIDKNIASTTPSKPMSFGSRRTSTVRQNYVKPTSYGHESFQETQNKLQNLVDLVMWRDASRSAFVFGIGAFTIISSSYTRDINISFITVISYLGLVYLAAIFLYRSIICRGYVDIRNTGTVLGEEEAIWLLKLVLPYLNEFLLKLRALFSGDPATTMKLAVLLFVMARCGSYITIWKMAKLGFFGAFTVPKVCSSYSTQISAYGKFWVRRFRDAWNTCSHKKAVAFAIFTIVWNLSSVVARIWAAFMLFVAFRYYQQSLVFTDDDWGNDVGGGEATCAPTKERKAS